MTDINSQEEVVAPEANENGGEGENSEVVTLKKEEYEKLNQTLGSLKRELKDLKKPKEEPKENKVENSKTEEFSLLHQTFLRSAGVVDEDEVELAKKIQKETNIEWGKLPDSKYFKTELEELRTNKSNAKATSNIRGGKGTSEAKNTPEFWLAKGVPPTPNDVPDRKTRAKIAMAFIEKAETNGKTFYNDLVDNKIKYSEITEKKLIELVKKLKNNN